MLKPNSQRVESMETKEVSVWVEGDTIPYSPISSVSFGISPDVTR